MISSTGGISANLVARLLANYCKFVFEAVLYHRAAMGSRGDYKGTKAVKCGEIPPQIVTGQISGSLAPQHLAEHGQKSRSGSSSTHKTVNLLQKENINTVGNPDGIDGSHRKTTTSKQGTSVSDFGIRLTLAASLSW